MKLMKLSYNARQQLILIVEGFLEVRSGPLSPSHFSLNHKVRYTLYTPTILGYYPIILQG